MASTQSINPAAPPNITRLLRSALVVMIGFAATKGVSLGQTIIIAGRFGAGADYDTFAAGSVVPDYIVRLIGGGALGVAFIPVFSALLNQNEHEQAWKLASRVFNTLLLITLGLSLTMMIFAHPLVNNLVAPGLTDAQTVQTANIMRILSVASILFCLSGIASAILHGHNHFLLPVLAPIFQDLGLLFGVIFFLDPFGIYGLAWGTLLGASLHLGIQIPGLLRVKFKWQPILNWRDPQLRQVLRLMLPRAAIGLTFVIDLLVITNINSRMGEGAISAFSWGLRFMDIPQALLGTAVGIVIFPSLSALNALGDTEKRLTRFKGALRFMLVTTIPASVGLVLVSYDALRILFDEWDSALIFTVIQVLSLAIIFQSLHEVFTRAFYAQQDTFRPFIYALITSSITLTVVLVGYQFYLATEPPLWSPFAVGITALGYVLTFAIEVILLAYFLRQSWGDIALGELWGVARQTLLATLIMAISVVVIRQMLVVLGFDLFTVSHIVIRILASAGTGIIAFYLAGRLIGIQEILEMWDTIRTIMTFEEEELIEEIMP